MSACSIPCSLSWGGVRPFTEASMSFIYVILDIIAAKGNNEQRIRSLHSKCTEEQSCKVWSDLECGTRMPLLWHTLDIYVAYAGQASVGPFLLSSSYFQSQSNSSFGPHSHSFRSGPLWGASPKHWLLSPAQQIDLISNSRATQPSLKEG